MEQEATLFAATCNVKYVKLNVWMVDNGCSNHMTHEAAIFKNSDKSFKTKVKLGNGEYINVKGKGVIVVETSSGTKFTHDVLYVPYQSKSIACCSNA